MADPIFTTNTAEAFHPTQYAFAAADVVPEALVLQHTTVAAQLEGDEALARVGFVVDDAASVTPEGQEIALNSPDLAEIELRTVKVTALVRSSNEQLRQVNTPQQLADSMSRSVTAKADHLLLAQAAPTGEATTPTPGLINQPGTVSKTNVAQNLDALIDAVAEVEANGAEPTAWIVSPDAYAGLSKLKVGGTETNLNILGAGVEAGERRLLGKPVVVSPQLPSKTGVLVSKRDIVSAVSPLFVATSEAGAFTADSTYSRATLRIGIGLPRNNRVAKFTLAAK